MVSRLISEHSDIFNGVNSNEVLSNYDQILLDHDPLKHLGRIAREQIHVIASRTDEVISFDLLSKTFESIKVPIHSVDGSHNFDTGKIFQKLVSEIMSDASEAKS